MARLPLVLQLLLTLLFVTVSTAVATVPVPTEVARTEIVFVDAGVADYQSLLAGVAPEVEVHLINGGDGVKQIAAALEGRSGIDALHIVSHGSAGAVYLGDAVLSGETLERYADELSRVGASLAADGDILLYGCNVAADAKAVNFIGQLAQQTGADVAASENLTGAADLGGDWRLEEQTGTIETLAALPFSENLTSYQHTLATFDFSTASGTGTVTQTVSGVLLTATTNSGGGLTVDTGVAIDYNNSATYIDFAFNSAIDVSSFKVGFYTNSGMITSFTIEGKVGGSTVHTYNVYPGYADLYDGIVYVPPYTVSLAGANDWGSVTSIRVTANGGGTVAFEADDIVFTAGDTIAPVFQNSTPSVSGTTLSQTTLTVRLDEPGTAYYVVVADGAGAPSVAQVKAGLNSAGGAALKSGSLNITSGGSDFNTNITGLSQSTAYDLYVVSQDDEGTPNVQGSVTLVNFTTQSPNSDGSLTAAAGVTEPVGLATTIDTVGEAADVFDFTLSDGGTSDALAMSVSQIVVNVSGTSTDTERAKITWRLNGPDASNVTGSYNAGSDTLTFSGLSISVANGGNETYTVNAYYNDNTSLTEDRTLILSVDGDTDLTLGASGTQMGATAAVTNGTGSTVDVTATQLAFTTQPAASTSGSALSTQPVVAARDAFGNTDVDFTETITLTEAAAGTLANNTQAATSGVATFTSLTYTATADQQSFTLTANDQDGVGSDLPTANANAVNCDVVATKLLFTTQPAPASVTSGMSTSFTTVPVVSSVDANNIVDTGYSTDIVLSEVNGAGSATMSATGDTDGSAATVSITPSSGVATFTGMQITYTASGVSETFNLRASSGGLTTVDSTSITAGTPPTVTDGNISISGASGTGGAFKIGDTVTATWNNAVGGDNNSGITGVTFNFSQFGGGAAVAASNSSSTWTATYTIVSGAIDASNRNVSVTAISAGGTTTTADTTNAAVDSVDPTVTDGSISLSGASGTGGAFKIGDTVTATWNNSAGGDNNSDTISSVTVDFSAFGGSAAVAASNSAGTWTATYMLVSGAIDGTNKNVSVTAVDNAGNSTATADTTNATVDNVVPTVTDGNISLFGASGTGGAYIIGDTVTATWNNTAGGDNNSDTISSVAVNFSAFGGGVAVVASNSSGTWTATYTITSGAIDGTSTNVSVTAIDNAGNTTTTADTTNATVDNVAPTVTDGNISISGATGSGGAFKVGDTVTATWNNTAGGDNNNDTISSVTVNFSAFGGGAAVVASNSSATWTATYTIQSGVVSGPNKNISVTVTDNAGNTSTTADSSNATVASIYTVTYNGNTHTGGAVPTDASSYYNTDTVTVLGNTGSLVKTGYTFAGWNTTANGSGTGYSGGDTFAMGSASVTLYAQWSAIDYIVTYDGNSNSGGAAPTDATAYNITDTVTVLGNTGSLVRTGYSFSGWNTAANGSGTGYSGGDTFAMGSANVTLYAQWTAIDYSVTYAGNSNSGGAVPTDATAYNITDTVTVLGNSGSLVKTGYTFAGWNTAANGSGAGYSGGATFAMGSANVTLYAQWTAIDYTVTYDGNTHTGGAVPTDATAYNITDTVTVLGNTGSLVKTGYTFAGWNTAANGSGTSYTGGATFAMGSANVTLYAQWTAIDYTVTYDGNTNTGGAVPTDGSTYNITDTVTVLGNTGSLVKTGYTFSGWNTAANGSGTSYTGGDTFAMGSADVTLYAQWTAIDYTITYAGNGSTGGAVPTDATAYHITDTVTVLGNTGSLVKTGYTFGGWNTAAGGSGTGYSGDDTFAMESSNVTLYAQWISGSVGIDDVNQEISFPDTGGTTPVAFVGPSTRHNTESGVVRVSNITSNSLNMRFQRWDYLGTAPLADTENVPYMIVAPGRYTMTDGSIWEVGTFEQILVPQFRFISHAFSEPFPEPPTVFLTVQTDNDPAAVVARIKKVNRSQVTVSLFEQELDRDGHGYETVGYLAIYSPSRSGRATLFNNEELPYLLQDAKINHQFSPMGSHAIRFEEEQSRDDETQHAKEKMAVLHLGSRLFVEAQGIKGRDVGTVSAMLNETASAMEWGVIDEVSSEWTTVPLAKRYTQPVVVARSLSAKGARNGVVQVRNVGSDAFEVRLQKWAYQKNEAKPETVFYLVVEAGSQTLAGLKVEAGTVDSALLVKDGAWEAVSFDTVFADSPAVFTSLNSSDGVQPALSRVRNLNSGGFELGMQEEEGRSAAHGSETLGWIAIEKGSGTSDDGRRIDILEELIDSRYTEIGFGPMDRIAPVFIGEIGSFNEADPCFLQVKKLAADAVVLKLQEEKSGDKETAHAAEKLFLFIAE